MFPHIRLEGTPHRQGLTHGRVARDRIHHNLELYFDRFQREGLLDQAEVFERAASYWQVIQAVDPGYAAAVDGVAEGAGEELLAIVALNVRYEILYHQFTAQALVDGCSAFALQPGRTQEGHLLLGQNWDWIPGVQGVMLETVGDPIDVLAFTEAGIVGGKIGLNSTGLGLAINGLMAVGDDWERLGTPFHVRCHQILRSSSVTQAAGIATAAPRACSANFLLGQRPADVVDVETSSAAVCHLAPADGVLLHTNHFLDPVALGITEPREDTVPRSRHRMRRFQALVADGGPLGVNEIQAILADHEGWPNQSLCRHTDPGAVASERYETVASLVMDLDAGRLWVSDGPPCRNPYVELQLGTVTPA